MVKRCLQVDLLITYHLCLHVKYFAMYGLLQAESDSILGLVFWHALPVPVLLPLVEIFGNI